MICPFCNEETFIKKKNLTEGWKITGTVDVCALCGKELKKVESKVNEDKTDQSRSRLAALLGGDFVEKVELSGSADRKFCRNCQHFLIHPFKSVCALTDKEADPMGECPHFLAK